MAQKPKRYRVAITHPAEESYYNILLYLYEYYSENQVVKLLATFGLLSGTNFKNPIVFSGCSDH